MMAEIISGKLMSEQLTIEQTARVAAMREQGIVPGLAVILAGGDPASEIYVRNKKTMCDTIGMYSEVVRLPVDVTQDRLLAEVERLNHNPAIHGILVQLPLPGHLDEAEVVSRVLPEKDVDGFHLTNVGKLFAGHPDVIPCTPKGILYMLKQANVPLKGKEAVVIGRSNIVGKPVAMLLLQEHCTVTICHSRTQNLEGIARRADILVAAIGRPRFVTGDMVKPGAAVIDVGINRVDGKLCGDVDFDEVSKVAGYITPVPGGVGKMTISMLMENALEAACRQTR